MKIELLEQVVALLAMGEPLPDKNRDHDLSLRQLPDRRHPALRMPERVTVHLRRKMAIRQKRRSHRMVRSAMI